jgi:thimet oligopeptidase
LTELDARMDATTSRTEGPPAELAGFQRAVRAAIERVRAGVEAFVELPRAASCATVLRAFDRLLAPLNGVEGRVGLYVHVHPDATVRAACEELEQEIAALRTELSLHRGLFDRLAALDPEDAPDTGARRVLEHALRDFRRSGVDRDEATRARITELQEELVRVGQEFDRNIVTGGREFVIAEGHAGLAGLPEDFLASHPEREDGSVVLSTDPADRIAFLTYAERGDLRRAYYREVMNRAVPQNLEVLPRILALRHELAGLFGYAHWADYVTEDKMTRSASEVRAFLERMIELVRARAAAEHDELLAKKREREPGAERVHEWERGYLIERVKKERCGFDSLEVRPYFPYARVAEGVLAISSTLYGVELRRDHEADVWHPSVECWSVFDGGELVARFYLDMHARPNKYKHAAMFHLAQGIAGEALPEAALICNFPQPSATDDALMMHDQVTTFFHEFGHLLHQLFAGRQRWFAFSGIATEHDFVEAPSQMYEEWAWSPAVLATFARHHRTGAPIPAELVVRMRAAEDYGKAVHVQNQMLYALLSLTYYDRSPEGLDLLATLKELKREVVPFPHEEGTHFHASFGHLNGYSAMYYTYMWSLVIAKDLFSAFDPDNMFDAEVAHRYRDLILAPGGTRDAADLVEEFLGRPYTFDAYAEWLAR